MSRCQLLPFEAVFRTVGAEMNINKHRFSKNTMQFSVFQTSLINTLILVVIHSQMFFFFNASVKLSPFL